MTMKKRIFLSNTLMVLVSLLILFGIGGVSVLFFKEEFMKRVRQNAELSENIYEVQTILLEQQKEPADWNRLSDSLSEYGFHLYVAENDEKIFSNAAHRELECIEELQEDEEQGEKNTVRIYSMENVSIAKCSITENGKTYKVYATYSPKNLTFLGMNRGMFEMFVIVFLIAGILCIAGLLLCSQLFTKYMIRKIMVPVDALNQAAERINGGNLSVPIVYERQDEFGEVCETFNIMQQHLKENMDKAKAYEQARTEMISGISHDLRTPLTSIKGFIKGMLDGVASTPEKQRQYLEISYQKAGDMERLLQKLFFVSKLETGNMPFFLKKTELGGWLSKYVEQKQKEETEEGYQITLENNTDTCVVNMDSEQMQRVLDNLLENSRRYSETEHLEIKILLQKEEDKAYLIFKDNGAGIAEDKLPHVFEQFYRGDEARNSKKDGSGLGLCVCKYIIEEQQGTIAAYNQNGFAVKIELPLQKEEG